MSVKSGSGAVNVAFAWAKVFPPAQEFEKRSDVFRILMPTAPARIKLIFVPWSLEIAVQMGISWSPLGFITARIYLVLYSA